MKITLLHTNDVHSHFGLWPRLVTLIQNARRRFGEISDRVILVDAGDHMDLSDQLTLGTGGRVNARLLNSAGYDYFVPGNNEAIRLTASQLREAAEMGSMKWLASNLRRKDLPEECPPGIELCTVVHANDLKVGLFGLTIHFPQAFEKQGFENPPASKVIPKLVSDLRANGCELIIFVSHMGLTSDRYFASQNYGIDVIVGAHSHDRLEHPEKHSETWIVQAGCFAEDLGILELERDASGRWNAQGHLQNVREWMPAADLKAEQVIQQSRAEAEVYLSKPLFSLGKSMPHHMTNGSPFAEFAAKALWMEFDADFALMNGGFSIQGLHEGTITRRDLIEACPSLLNPGVVLMTGRQLYEFFEEAEREDKYNRFVPGKGLRGEGVVMGRIYTYRLDLNKEPEAPSGSVIRHLSTLGKPIEPDRAYRVAAPAIFSGSFSGYSSLEGAALIDWISPGLIRDVIEKQFGDNRNRE